ncbi:DgyrCDS553 [Dimorphilus gyrociliatus]|uniref:DgyrCDS553 n=1 Tax=Dimorphilus gyrociliatus TaxID=2664684 RepID=A0A7I8V6R0_9ANNE|nr:DgyrCDS553 [Dimorphilus gyrociliatus]
MEGNKRDSVRVTVQYLNVEGGEKEKRKIGKHSTTIMEDDDSDSKEYFAVMKSKSYKKNPWQKKRGYGIKLLVIFILISIVVGVALIYYLYNEKRENLELNIRIKFIENERLLKVEDLEHKLLLFARFGSDITTDLPFDCTTNNRLKNLCLIWRKIANLTISHVIKKNIGCYDISWTAFENALKFEDIFEITQESDAWYGGSLSKDQQWPINKKHRSKRLFTTGRYSEALERYWITARGVSLIYTSPYPVEYEVDELSIKLRTNVPANSSISYRICTGKDIKQIHLHTIDTEWAKNGLKHRKLANSKLFNSILWSMEKFCREECNSKKLIKFSRLISKFYSKYRNIINLDNKWEKYIGDFTFDKEKYKNVTNIFSIVKSKGIQTNLELSTYVHIRSDNFAKLPHLFVRDAGGNVPGLCVDNNTYSGVFDMHKASTMWISNTIDRLLKANPIDYISLRGGFVEGLPFEAKFYDDFVEPTTYSKSFSKFGSDMTKIIYVTTIYQNNVFPKAIWLKLSDRNSTYIIATALQLGILGYPFFITGAFHKYHVETEVFIRQIQLVTWMPVMHLGTIPDAVKDDRVHEAFKNCLHYRQTLVLPMLRKLSTNATRRLIPLVRPLWWIAPNDLTALKTYDQFLLGDKFLIAPILNSFQRSRDIYLPEGQWKCLINRKLYNVTTEGLHLKNLAISLSEIAVFERLAR